MFKCFNPQERHTKYTDMIAIMHWHFCRLILSLMVELWWALLSSHCFNHCRQYVMCMIIGVSHRYELVSSHGGGQCRVVYPLLLEFFNRSDLWWQAYSSLLNESENQCLQLSIPCFVSSEAHGSELDTVAFRWGGGVRHAHVLCIVLCNNYCHSVQMYRLGM